MEHPSSSPFNSKVQFDDFSDYVDATAGLLTRKHSRLQDDAPLRNVGGYPLQHRSDCGMKHIAVAAADTADRALSAKVLPLQVSDLSLSTIPSGGPSPLSELSYRAQRHGSPHSSLAHPSQRQMSVSSEPREGEVSRSAYKEAHQSASSHSFISSFHKAQPTSGGTPYVSSFASATMPPESLDSPDRPRPVVCSTEDSMDSNRVFLSAAESGAVQPSNAATLRTPPELTGMNNHCLPRVSYPHFTPAGAAASAPAVIQNETNVEDETTWLRKATQDGVGVEGLSARHPHPLQFFTLDSPSAASRQDENRAAASHDTVLRTPNHPAPLQRSPLSDVLPVPYTTSTPPPPEVKASDWGIMWRGCALFQPAAYSPSQGFPCPRISSASLSLTNYMTGVFTEQGTPYQPSGQEQQQRALPTPSRHVTTSVRQRFFDSSTLPPRQKSALTSHETPAAATTESHDSTLPFRALWGSFPSTTKLPRDDMDTQIFPGTPLLYTPVQPRVPRALIFRDTPDTPGTATSRENQTTSEGIIRHGHTHDDCLAARSPMEIGATTENSSRPALGSPISSLGHAHQNLDKHCTPRDVSAATHASKSPFAAPSLAAAGDVRYPGPRSVPSSEQECAATTPSTPAARTEELKCGSSTPTSPHTPLANRTSGFVGLHDNSITQPSLGHSHSRYRSQVPSQLITPHKSARRAFSRQTTPSQSFRSKVQSNNFEIQQQHRMTQNLRDPTKLDGPLSSHRSLMNGVPTSIAERDYLAPSRNPFYLSRILNSFILNPSMHPLHTTPAAGTPDAGLAEYCLSRKQVLFVNAVRSAVLRPDAAVVLYEQIVPSALRPSGALTRTQMERNVFLNPPTPALEDSAWEFGPPWPKLSLSAPCRGGKGGQLCKMSSEGDTAVTLGGLPDTSDGCADGVSLFSGEKPTAHSPTKSVQSGGQQRNVPNLLSGSSANIEGATESVTLPELNLSTPKSFSCDGLQTATSPVATTTRNDASPPARSCKSSPTTVTPYCLPRADCPAPRRNWYLQSAHMDDDVEESLSGPDRADRPFSPASVDKAGTLKTVHAWDPIELRAAEGSTSTWASHGSPNILKHTASYASFFSSGQPLHKRGGDALCIPRTPPPRQTPEWERTPPTRDRKETAATVFIPSLNLTSLAKYTRQSKCTTPNPTPPQQQQRQHLSPDGYFSGLRIPNDASWGRRGQIPALSGVGQRAFFLDSADATSPPIGFRLAECVSALHDTANESDEDIPGDRFQAHHTFQFLHCAAPISRRGDASVGASEEGRRPIPLSVEVNGITWLAVHRLNGLPYAVKEVPSSAFSLAELRCLTLSMSCPSIGATAKEKVYAELSGTCSTTLTAQDRLEMEDYIARYYSISTPPQSSSRPEVHLLQLEYFPRGSLWELTTRCKRNPWTLSPNESPSTVAGVGALGSRFWLSAVTQGLRGLRVLHCAYLIHGCPLPLSLFLCGSTSSSLRFKWGCFGNAQSHADVYPTDSLPAWVKAAISRLYDPLRSGTSTVAPDVVEVGIFCLGILDVMVNDVYAARFDVLGSPESDCLNKLERIEAVVTHPESGSCTTVKNDDNDDMQKSVHLIHLLWDVSHSFNTANQALVRLGAHIDPAAQAVEQLYECELDRLTHQLEELRRRGGQQSQMQTLERASKCPTFLTEESSTHSSEVKATVTSASPRRHVDTNTLLSPQLHAAPDPTFMTGSCSSFGAGPPPSRSRRDTPNWFPSTRAPLHHTHPERPDASVYAAPSQLERTISEMTKQGGSNSVLGHRRRLDIHPVMLEAANYMLEKALSCSGDGMQDAMAALWSPLVESMRQREWTTVLEGVPSKLIEDSNANACTEPCEPVEKNIRSLRPITSFE